MSETDDADERNVYAIDMTPDMLKELLEDGQIVKEQNDGTTIFLNYETIPKFHSEGFQE